VERYGLKQKLLDAGALELDNVILCRYADGEILCVRPGGEKMVRDYGAPWLSVLPLSIFFSLRL
jgi:hypothetical protein